MQQGVENKNKMKLLMLKKNRLYKCQFGVFCVYARRTFFIF